MLRLRSDGIGEDPTDRDTSGEVPPNNRSQASYRYHPARVDLAEFLAHTP